MKLLIFDMKYKHPPSPFLYMPLFNSCSNFSYKGSTPPLVFQSIIYKQQYIIGKKKEESTYGAEEDIYLSRKIKIKKPAKVAKECIQVFL